MDERIARELIAVRRAVKKKYQSLRSDMTQADLELEKQWKPLKELVNVVKREPMMETRITPRRGSTMMFEKDIRKKASSTPIHLKPDTIAENTASPPPVEYLKSETIAESSGESLPEKSSSPKSWQKQHHKAKEIEKEMAQMMQSHVLGSYLDAFSSPVRKYVKALIFDKQNEFDTERGINLDLYTNKFTMGNKTVEFRDNIFVILDTKGKEMMQYQISPGLLELLFKNYPKDELIDEGDKRMYHSILHFTSAHKRNYDPTQQIKGSRGIKYKKIIQHNVSYKTTSKRGKGLLTVNNKKVEFVPWKDPNTLVERLKLLMASQLAGHTSHNNEIISIIDALRKAKIIK